jgi:hypothetical protein
VVYGNSNTAARAPIAGYLSPPQESVS